jgi:hypothetical protein
MHWLLPLTFCNETVLVLTLKLNDPADLYPSVQGGFYCFENQQYVQQEKAS